MLLDCSLENALLVEPLHVVPVVNLKVQEMSVANTLIAVKIVFWSLAAIPCHGGQDS